MLHDHLNNFIQYLQQNPAVELYNEAGLQHELGFFLRERLPNGYKIQLERNIEAILGTKQGFCKKEIDMFITGGNSKKAIELKMPINKQIPRRMELTFEDVRFLEQLKNNGFDECYLLFTSNVKSFWDSRREQIIYEYFNDGVIKTLKESDVPPFIQNSETAFNEMKETYNFEWQDLKVQDNKQWRYFLLEV
jgi:hypothetical protein